MKAKIKNTLKSNSTFFLLFLLAIMIIFFIILIRFYRSMSDAAVRESFLGIGIDVNSVDAWCNSVDGVKPCINKPAHNEGLEEKAHVDPVAENGICLTDDGEWGIKLKEYGRKCISLNIIKNKQNNIQLAAGEGSISGEATSTGTGTSSEGTGSNEEAGGGNIVFGMNMDRVPPIVGKNQTECIEIDPMMDKKKRNEMMDQQCRNKFGEQYGLERVVECDKNGKMISGVCSTDYFNGQKITENITNECHYYTENLDNICKTQMNNNLMMAERVFIGADGGCYKENTTGTYDPDTGKMRVMCGDNAGINETPCLSWQTNFEEECKKRGGNGKVAAKIISTCPIGKRRAICEM